MVANISLSYRYDGTPDQINDDFGRLDMCVQTEVRWGKGGFWVQWQDLLEFAESLSTYPIPADNPVVAEWGYREEGRSETVLKIEICPSDTRGSLRVRSEIADEYDPQDRVQAVFETHYPDLAAFRAEIGRMMKGEIAEARLRGS